MNKSTQTKVISAVQRCNRYINELWSLEDRNKTSAAVYKRACEARDKLLDSIAGDGVGEYDWTDDVLYELGVALHLHEQRAGAKSKRCRAA